MADSKLVLVSGATGYIARALTPYLLERGYRVRCLARNPHSLYKRAAFSQVEVVQGDVTDFASLQRAMVGVSTAFYLVHNMDSGRTYHQRDIAGAANFAAAAAANGVEHIIYLGGLADPRADIGYHMRSRIQTGETLRRGPVPVTEFRASLIIGPGSISFEMIRYLTEFFPILTGPRWMHYYTQPIAIQNVVEFLLAAVENPTCRGKIYEIGGLDVLTYGEALLAYARSRGLKRRVVMLPRLPVPLMAFVVGKLTPVHYAIASPLIDGMRSDSIVQDHQAKIDFAQIELLDYHAAVHSALDKLHPAHVDRVWDNSDTNHGRPFKQQGFFIDCKHATLQVSPEAVYQAFASLGGKDGWLYLNILWKFRGFVDRLFGGPGMRGRPHDRELCKGDVVDFYHVEAIVPGQLLRLKAELKAPGAGWMEWHVSEQPDGSARLTQVAYFAPKGAGGFLYWYLLMPFHRMVFAGLFESLIHLAKKNQRMILSSKFRIQEEGIS